MNRKQHYLAQYSTWEAQRVLPNPGDVYAKARRYLFFLLRSGDINFDEATGWEGTLVDQLKSTEQTEADDYHGDPWDN